MNALRLVATYSPTTDFPDGFLPRLSRRQRQVAQLVADGFTNKQVAAMLDLKEQTVRRYLMRIAERMELDRSKNVRVLITREVVFAWAEAA